MNGKTMYCKIFLIMLIFSVAFVPSAFSHDYPTILSGVFDTVLYPEYNFSLYPSFLHSLDRAYSVYESQSDFSYEKYQSERISDEIGQIGGTSTNTLLLFGSDLSGSFYQATDKTKGMLRLYGALDFENMSNLDKDYNKATERTEQNLRAYPFHLGTSLIFVPQVAALISAYSLNYQVAYSPAVFLWETDASVNPGIVHSPSFRDTADSLKHNADILGDWQMTLGIFETNLTLAYYFGHRNRDRSYHAVDTTGDNLLDTVMLLSEWLLTKNTDEITYGPEDEVTKFEHQDRAFHHRIELGLFSRFAVSENVNSFLEFHYTPWDQYAREYYTRIFTEDIPKDESLNKQILTATPFNGRLNTVLTIKPENGKNVWRFGLGLQRDHFLLQLDGLQASGQPVYRRENIGHYLEHYLGENPVKGSIIESAVDPAETIIHSAALKLGFEMIPSKDYLLSSSIGLQATQHIEYFRVYNLNTNTVWEESRESMTVLWGLVPRIALSRKLGENSVLTWELGSVGMPGLYTHTAETQAKDLTKNTVSNDGQFDLFFSTAMKFQFRFQIVIY